LLKQEITVHHSVPHEFARAILRHISIALALALLAAPLAACNERAATTVERAAFVHTEVVQPRDGQASLTLTGEVQARFRADLSFRVSGRVLARLVDVGAHVNAGDLLARLDPAEQQADFDAATAGVAAAEAQLRVAQATFDRQDQLLSSGFTTRVAYDQAQEQLRTAQSTLESAKAELGRTREALGDTELRARAAGVITTRNLEVGQVVQAAQSVFTLAQDGERDAVFDVPESMLLGDVETGNVSLALVSGPNVTATGYVREISPAVDPKSATVRAKVAIQNPPPAMTLGSAIAGTAGTKPVTEITLPWTALMGVGSKPGVWIVDPKTNTASLKPVTVGAYEAGAVLIKEGLEAGDRVVIDGGKLLSSGQPVTYGEDRS
jgi:RND family efflux transporter MFP subunit